MSNGSETASPLTMEFPQIPRRTGRNKLNPAVMKALVHCQSTYKVSDNDIKGLIVDQDTANKMKFAPLTN